MKRFFSRGGLALFFFLASCNKEKIERPEPVYPVELSEVIKQDVPISIEAIGNVFSPQIVQIRPQVSGVVKEAYVRQGDDVQAGAPLYLIDPRPYEAALKKAEAALIRDTAALEFAKSKVDRYTDLSKKDYVSKLNFDQYQSDVETNRGLVLSDEADIATAKLNLEWSTIYSPISGKISQFDIYPGNIVAAYDASALTNVRQMDPLDIQFHINQRDFARMQHAQKEGSLTFEVYSPQRKEEKKKGTIYFFDNQIDTATGTILIKGTVENREELFWPGEFVRVSLILGTLKEALVVPEESIRLGQEGAYLYLYDAKSQTVKYQKVVKGPSDQGKVVIQEGVAAGDQVVVKGQLNLRPDAKVLVKNP